MTQDNMTQDGDNVIICPRTGTIDSHALTRNMTQDGADSSDHCTHWKDVVQCLDIP